MDNHVLPRSKISKMRALGMLPSGLVDYEPARRHARFLHNHHGMSMRQIADGSNTSMSTISELLSGYRSGRQHSGMIRRTVSDAILAVQPEPFTGPRGAEFPALGMQRRIMALQAVGYSQMFMSCYLGYPKGSKSYVGTLLRNQYTHTNMWAKVDAMYRKLRYVDPVDMGIEAEQRDRSIGRARRKRFAPPGAWDDDLIDDLSARPEWTGACGTMRGVRIHRQENILPLCPPCKSAQTEDLKRLKEKYDS